jgi:hypothetical protein
MPYPLMEQTLALNPLIPHLPSPKQYQFLELECLDAMYGGAAGGGKSDALLMGGVQFWEVPGYAALILRRTLADLKKPGALLDRSREWFGGSGVGARYNSQDHRWRFPSGATLQFGYCENEPTSSSTGRANSSSSGSTRGRSSPSSSSGTCSRGSAAGRTSPCPSGTGSAPTPAGRRTSSSSGGTSRRGRPARCSCPPGSTTTRASTGRRTCCRLAELDPLTRAQLEAGDWDAVAGGRFRRDWFYPPVDPPRRLHPGPRPGGAARIRVHARARRRRGSSPWTRRPRRATRADYTVISDWVLSRRADLIWLGCERFKAEIPDIVPRISAAYTRAGRPMPSFVGIEAIASNRPCSSSRAGHERPVSPPGR